MANTQKLWKMGLYLKKIPKSGYRFLPKWPLNGWPFCGTSGRPLSKPNMSTPWAAMSGTNCCFTIKFHTLHILKFQDTIKYRVLHYYLQKHKQYTVAYSCHRISSIPHLNIFYFSMITHFPKQTNIIIFAQTCNSHKKKIILNFKQTRREQSA